MLYRSLLLVAGLCGSHSVAAVCYFDGKAYPTGAVVNGYACQADGTWKKGGRYPNLDANRLAQARGAMTETTSPVASASGKCAEYEYFSCRPGAAQTSL
jgi:hypothetical protein